MNFGLVDELRRNAVDVGVGETARLLREAADVIERMRALIARLRPDPPESEDYYT